MSFRLTLRLMFLDDLEPIRSNVIEISRDFAIMQGKNGQTNEDRPIMWAT